MWANGGVATSYSFVRITSYYKLLFHLLFDWLVDGHLPLLPQVDGGVDGGMAAIYPFPFVHDFIFRVESAWTPPTFFGERWFSGWWSWLPPTKFAFVLTDRGVSTFRCL